MLARIWREEMDAFVIDAEPIDLVVANDYTAATHDPTSTDLTGERWSSSSLLPARCSRALAHRQRQPLAAPHP
jgi:hypothetical protein